MSHLRALVVLLAAVMLACVPPPPRPAASSAPAAETPEQMIAAAKALDAQFFDAFNRGDLEGMVATYWQNPDVVLYPPDALEARGTDGVRAALGHALAGMGGGKLELLEPTYEAHGDVVVTWGRWRLTMPTAGAAPVEMVGRLTQVSARRDGRWVYLHDHASLPMPPPPAPAGASVP